MAEKENKNQPKDLIEATPEEEKKLEKEEIRSQQREITQESENISEQNIEESNIEIKSEPNKEIKKPNEEKIIIDRRLRQLDRKQKEIERQQEALSSWIPRTKLGLLVKKGKIKDLDEVLINHKKILEPEIVDILIKPDSDLILIGQAKGKFGGGKRRAWRQILTFSSMAVIGDRKTHIGLGFGKAKETLPAREKALRNAKLNVFKIKKGFEDPLDNSDDPHTVPFKVVGKASSSIITLIPAPRGTGLAIAEECKKILRLAGIKDVYGKTLGKTKTTFNLAKACVNALSKTTQMEYL
jgi:small subunit ribosomal protein S5